MKTVFLLSPASASGRRAQLLTRPEAGFDLAVRLRAGPVPIGEVFSFLSGLYFRGKQTYALTHADADDVQVITPTRGLLPVHAPITLATLREFATVDIAAGDPRYREPLERDCRTLAQVSGARPVVLLGSIASSKYVEILLAHFGGRLMFPADFVGRGDMSRGGLLLRAVAERRELPLAPVAGAARHGARPPKLPRPGRAC